MAQKAFELAGIGTVTLYKRRGVKSLRLSVDAHGSIRITMPHWVPYAAGVQFALARKQWIISHQPEKQSMLEHGLKIGKAHRLQFIRSDIGKPTSRIAGSEIRIHHPHDMTHTHDDVQSIAQQASVRALRKQAEALLPARLRALAREHGFAYTSVQVKQLKSRWGSCDTNKRIVLNLYLMQLPWELIDYVLLHELVHTKHLNHSAEFWDEFTRCQPNARQLRRTIRQHKPVLAAVDLPTTVA